MYFTLLGKKEITIKADVSAKKIADLIQENIHNRKSIFEKDKPFSGEGNGNTFSLGLNESDGRASPFSRFSCVVLGDDKSAEIHLLFKNDFYKISYLLLHAILIAVLALSSKYRFFYLAIFPFMLVLYTIKFNIKLNRCAEEVQYIADKAFISSSSL